MNRIYLLMLLLISCSLHISAQTDYYYYQGKKIPLTRNEEKVVVSIPKENVETSRRISANTQILSTISKIRGSVLLIILNLQKLSTTNTSKVMGKSVVLLLLSVCSISVYAQREWESLLQDGKVWTMEYSNVYSEQCDYSDVVLRSDTVIDGIPFKSSDGLFWIGQKDGVIYQYEEFFNLGQVCPIMDFSLNVGDEFVIYEKEYDEDADTVATWVLDKLDVIAVSDTVLASSTDRSQRHCVYVKSLRNNQQQECWVEGIGSLTYGILGYRVGWYGSSKRLFQCKQGDEVLYAADTTASIRPSLKQKNSKEIFFDLQGRRINGEPKRGLYIRDGKKVKKF